MATTDLPPDVRAAVRAAMGTEAQGSRSAQALTIIAQNIDQAATGRRFRRDPWLVARKQNEHATLGTGMLDRDPHEPLDELVEDDLARHRLRGLEHGPDIQLFDGRTNGSGGRCRDWCVAEMRMKLFELPDLAVGSPA